MKTLLSTTLNGTIIEKDKRRNGQKDGKKLQSVQQEWVQLECPYNGRQMDTRNQNNNKTKIYNTVFIPTVSSQNFFTCIFCQFKKAIRRKYLHMKDYITFSIIYIIYSIYCEIEI